MKELIGACMSCNKEIYCLGGFFNGVHTDDKKLYCFECAQTLDVKEDPQS